MKRLLLLTIILFSITQLSYSQEIITESETHLYWQPNRKLTCDDFKGTISSQETADLHCNERNMCTMAYIGVFSILDIPSKKKDRGKYLEKAHFAAAFDKKKSYSLSENDTIGVLKQQVVFDIYELSARYARKRMSEAMATMNAYGTMHLMFASIKQGAEEFRSSLVDPYVHDVYTLNREGAYEEWRKSVDKALEELQEFATSPEDCYRFVTGKPLDKRYKMAEYIYPM